MPDCIGEGLPVAGAGDLVELGDLDRNDPEGLAAPLQARKCKRDRLVQSVEVGKAGLPVGRREYVELQPERADLLSVFGDSRLELGDATVRGCELIVG
jgi:hypothetical protein